LNTEEVLDYSNNSISDVVYASIWILGEFINETPEELKKDQVLKLLLNGNFSKFNSKVQSCCCQSILKIFSSSLSSSKEEVENMRDLIRKNFDMFLKSSDIEVQERVKILII
jgi:hypothetical protein